MTDLLVLWLGWLALGAWAGYRTLRGTCRVLARELHRALFSDHDPREAR